MLICIHQHKRFLTQLGRACMDEQKNYVQIEAWPKEPAQLEHDFKGKKPCPVSISFENTSANVVIQTTPNEPFHVDMSMHVDVRDQLPVCIRLCEPICVKSDYTVGLDIFDRPVATVTVRGLTRIFNCEEESPHPRVCTSFQKYKEKTVFKDSVTLDSLVFTPIDGQLEIIVWGEPSSHNKLAFSSEGIKVKFPYPVKSVILYIGNYGGSEIHVLVYSNDILVDEIVEGINNEVKELIIDRVGTTAVIVKGGNNEAYIAEVCYQ
jgi:hypothetical protein